MLDCVSLERKYHFYDSKKNETTKTFTFTYCCHRTTIIPVEILKKSSVIQKIFLFSAAPSFAVEPTRTEVWQVEKFKIQKFKYNRSD